MSSTNLHESTWIFQKFTNGINDNQPISFYFIHHSILISFRPIVPTVQLIVPLDVRSGFTWYTAILIFQPMRVHFIHLTLWSCPRSFNSILSRSPFYRWKKCYWNVLIQGIRRQSYDYKSLRRFFHDFSASVFQISAKWRGYT